MGRLEGIRLLMLDMDGTFYLGDALLPGALETLAACRQKGVKYTFLTNNSSKSPEDYIKKLARLGASVAPEEMLTSGEATIAWLDGQGIGRDIHLFGTESLHRQFAAAGYRTRAENPAAVVLGFDTTADYAKITALCDAVRTGAPYIATHPDYNCPVPGGVIPDAGSFAALVEASTGRKPDAVIGKPSGAIAQMAAARAGVPLGAVCMVGDRLYTDIALGRAGVKTALVLSGETTEADLAASDIKPDYVYQNLAGLAAELLAR